MSEKKIFTNTFYQIFTKIVTSGSGFIITILIARYFGAKVYGDFTKITTFISFFYLLADFGLNAVFLQLEEKENRFSHLLSLRLFLSLLIIIAVNGLVLLLPFNHYQDTGFSPQLRLGSFIFSLTIIFQAIILSSAAIIQKKLRYDLYLFSMTAGALITLALIFLASIFHMTLEYILLSYVVGNIISAALSLLTLSENIKSLIFSKNFSFKILKDSLPLGLMLIFNLIYFRADIIILSFLKNTVDVALYGYAYKYFEFLLAIPLFLSNAVYPFLLGSLKNLRSYYAFSQKYLLIFLLISILVIIPSWFVAPLIAIINKDFILSVTIFRILLLSLPVFFLTNILQWILIAKNKKTYLLKIYVLAGLFNIILNLLFIPKYSYFAAAVTTGLSETLILILLFYKFTTLKYQEDVPEKFTNLRKNYDNQK